MTEPPERGPRHLAKGATRRTRETPPNGRNDATSPPRLRESERLRERMRAQRVSGDDLPPMPTRPSGRPWCWSWPPVRPAPTTAAGRR